ncbi:MAG: 6-bladed beta-propeller [Candidatus Aminicenantes bacterium]|nr:MAG: 6-bladed beta-propeller [Candidatus Aminicenantes bacterium]
MNKIFVIFGVIVSLIFISCSSEKGYTSRTDFPKESPDGNVEIISNSSKGLWGEDKQISLEEELVIGKEYGDDEEMFGYIRIITYDGKGKIFIADSYELTVMVFDEQGKFINSFGKEGNGPGEFITMDDIHWCRFDNLLYIPDRRNNRINKFSSDGKFIEALKTSKFKIRVMGIASFEDGKFMLTGMRFGGNFADYRIIVVDHSFDNVLAEYGEDFLCHRIGMEYFPNFSDVGIVSGTQLYYTSPSEYKIVLFDRNLDKNKIIIKTYPKMFTPQYVRGFYSDFNGIENIAKVNGNYIVGVSYTNTKEMPLFQQKMELVNFVDNEKESSYQLDIFDGDFQFLTSVRIPPERRLAGADSKGRLYFIENDPFPRLIRCTIKAE